MFWYPNRFEKVSRETDNLYGNCLLIPKIGTTFVGFLKTTLVARSSNEGVGIFGFNFLVSGIIIRGLIFVMNSHLLGNSFLF